MGGAAVPRYSCALGGAYMATLASYGTVPILFTDVNCDFAQSLDVNLNGAGSRRDFHTVCSDPTWMWKHQREQMSYYENVMRENFDWIVFAINDTVSWTMAWTELDDYFRQEVTNRALVEYSVKIDSENNNSTTMAQGDANCAIQLKLPDTIERFNIVVSRVGVFENVG